MSYYQNKANLTGGGAFEIEELYQNEENRRKVPFADLCRKNSKYQSYLKYNTYKASQVIYSNGSKIDQFGIVISGLLRAENYTSKGVELCNAYFECKDIFPEFLYFSGMRSYSYSLIAVKKSTVAWIPAHYFEQMLEEDSDMMYSFMLYVCQRGLKNQLRIHCLNYQTIRERVAFWILGIQQFFESDRIIMSGSQRILANTLHVSRSSLNQELKKMEREGCFRIQEGEFIEIDEEKLRDIL